MSAAGLHLRLVAAGLTLLMSAAAGATEDEEAAPRPAAASPAASGASGAAAPLPTPDRVDIPATSGPALATQVWKPAGAGPFPTLVFNHGRAPDARGRNGLKFPISNELVRYWLSRGFAIVAPIRQGYGDTGGTDVEKDGAHFNDMGSCDRRPDYRGALEAARQSVRPVIAWVRAQPWVRTDRLLIGGQSMGGYTAIGLSAEPPQGVLGFINFAGGAGGNPERSPFHNCDPDQLGDIFGELGRRAPLPSLWIYAENDQYFGPDAPKAWFAAYAKGSPQARFIAAPAVPDGDGHGLSRHSRRLWSGYLDGFLEQLGLRKPPAAAPSAASGAD